MDALVRLVMELYGPFVEAYFKFSIGLTLLYGTLQDSYFALKSRN